MIEIKNIRNSGSTAKGIIVFDTDNGEMQINQTDALKIAFSLVDSLGLSYSILDEIEDKLMEE